MSDVQPTNNPVPSDNPADARDNFKRIDEVVNLQAERTSPTRTGRTLETLYGLRQTYLQAIREGGGSPLNNGVWAAGQTFTAYNQFMVYNDVPYRPLTTTSLPYGPTGSAPDFTQVGPYIELTSSDLAGLIIYQANSVADMTNNGSPNGTGVSIGGDEINYSENTRWMISGENGAFRVFEVITTSSDIDLGGGFWARELDYLAPTEAAASRVYRIGERLKIETQLFYYEFECAVDNTSIGITILDRLEDNTFTLTSQNRKVGKAFQYPTGWTGPTPDVWFSPDGKWTMDNTDRVEFRNFYGVTAAAPRRQSYFVTISGDDSNDGLTPDTGLASLDAAFAKTDAWTIYAEGGGIYSMNLGGGRFSYNLIGYGDKKAIIYTPVSTSFASSGITNVWVNNGNGASNFEKPASARLFDNNGIPIGYKQVASAAEVSEKPLTYFIDTATKQLFVHSSYEPVVGVDIFASYTGQGNNLISSNTEYDGIQVYMENIIFPLSVRAIALDSFTTNPRIYAQHVFCGGSTDKGAALNSWSLKFCDSVLHRCIAAYSDNDGFNYDGGSQIESECRAYANGIIASDQASTSHVSGLTLRIGCDFECAQQNAVLDVDNGQTINLGVRVTARKQTGVVFGSATNREMWCYDCFPSGLASSSSDGHYRNDSGNNMYLDTILSNGIGTRSCTLVTE